MINSAFKTSFIKLSSSSLAATLTSPKALISGHTLCSIFIFASVKTIIAMTAPVEIKNIDIS
jgi:hypothetical protein